MQVCFFWFFFWRLFTTWVVIGEWNRTRAGCLPTHFYDLLYGDKSVIRAQVCEKILWQMIKLTLPQISRPT